MSGPRYAIYTAPDPASPLWAFGSATIGYDAATGRDVAQTPLAGFDGPGWSAATAEPRRYGFHGTLKPPFYLAEGRSEADLAEALDRFAAMTSAVDVGAVRVTALGRFLALCPPAPVAALDRLAGRVVEDFDAFRAALTPEDRARRNPDKLTERQRDHLDRWGYPYVFEDFRYHMTLTGQVAPERLADVRAALTAAHAAAVPDARHVVDALVLFVQERRDGRFRIRSRHRLRAF